MTYNITFFSQNTSTSHTISIISSGAGTTTLKGAADPFRWDEDDNEDIRPGLRAKTGRITVVIEDRNVIEGLLPTGPKSHRVTLDGATIGYLRQQNFSIPLTPAPFKLTLNVASPLVLMNTTEIEPFVPAGEIRLWQLIDRAVNQFVYRWVIFPILRNQDSETETTAPSIEFCPFANDKDFHYETEESLYSPPTCQQILEQICRDYGLQAHDIIYNGEPCLLFQRMKHNTRYELLDIDNNGERSAVITPSTSPVTDSFTNKSADNEERIAMPFSKVTVRGREYNTDDIVFNAEHSNYVARRVNVHTMRPTGRELYSSLFSTSTALDDGVFLVGYDGEKNNGEYIVANISGNVSDNRMEMFQLTFYEYQWRGFAISATLIKGFESDEMDGNHKFYYSVEQNGKYWEDVNQEWVSTPQIYDAETNEDGTWLSDITVTPASYRPVTVRFYAHFPYQTRAKYYFREIALTTRTADIDKYSAPRGNTNVIRGQQGNTSSISLDISWSLGRAGSLEYLVTASNILEVTVESTRSITASDYIDGWTYNGRTYKLLAVRTSLWRNEQTLLFIANGNF